jgi:cation diffusion facilitator CzcD-associated flavoprotein CzcO
VVTDRITEFTEGGIRLESGRELEADVIVTATGLNLQLLGGITLSVDGTPGVPNLAFAIGYTTSSWTLKIGLLCQHFCALLSHMDAGGYTVCYPETPSPAVPTRPLLDFSAGYVQRSLHMLPRQGDAAPWLTSMNYADDVKLLHADEVTDYDLRFRTPAADMAVTT